MINHLLRIGLIEDLATDNVVVLSNVTEGVDGAGLFGYTRSEQTVTIEDNDQVMDRMEHALDVRTIVGTAAQETDLDNFTSNVTKIYISGVLADGFMLWGDKQTGKGLIRIGKANKYALRKSHGIMITRQATPGFDPDTGLHSGAVWVGENGLGMFVWGDADADGTADGWDSTGFTTASFATGQQTLEADLTQRDFERAIYFPFESVELTFSLDNDSRTGSYATEQIEIEFLDAADTVISSKVTTFSTTGRKSVTETTPADTVQVVCRFSIAASTGTVTSVVSDPALRIGTETAYIKF